MSVTVNRPPKGTPEGGLTMSTSTVTPKQSSKTLQLIAESGISSEQYQKGVLESGAFTDLLRKAMETPDIPEPTITPIPFSPAPGSTLVEMRDAMGLDGYVNPSFNDGNFPIENRKDDDREFVLVCFNRAIDDDEDPEKSELLRELGKLGLEPEGPPELCGVGISHPDLQREFPIVARRQVWRGPLGSVYCPVLSVYDGGRKLLLDRVRGGWYGTCRFLASRKKSS